MSRKQQPTRRQAVAVRDQRQRAAVVRDQRETHAGRAMARVMSAIKRRRTAAGPKAERPIEYVVQYTVPSRPFRAPGRRAGSGNTPYVNPDRDAKSARSGRLRKELR